VPSPELRCLECNRQFADLTADQEVERCAECGKFVVAAPTLLTAMVPTPGPVPVDLVADLLADEAVPTVAKAKAAADLPLAQPVRPSSPPTTSAMPAWARRPDDAPTPAKPADTVRPTFPPRPATTPRPPAQAMSNTELPNQIDAKKQKVGFALFIAFLFLLAMIAAIGVLVYTIVRGLQMKKVISEVVPAVQPFSRASES